MTYTHDNVRRTYIHIKRALPNMFKYIDNPSIPNNTNSLESFFGHLKLKQKATICLGLIAQFGPVSGSQLVKMLELSGGWKARKDCKDRITGMDSEAGKVRNLENINYDIHTTPEGRVTKVEMEKKVKGKNVWVELKQLNNE